MVMSSGRALGAGARELDHRGRIPWATIVAAFAPNIRTNPIGARQCSAASWRALSRSKRETERIQRSDRMDRTEPKTKRTRTQRRGNGTRSQRNRTNPDAGSPQTCGCQKSNEPEKSRLFNNLGFATARS
jgi:hypothetical protein